MPPKRTLWTAFEFDVTEFEPINVVRVVQQLLDWCDEGQAELHSDMNRIEGRFFKNRIRAWLTSFLKSHIDTPWLDSETIRVFDAILDVDISADSLMRRLRFILREIAGAQAGVDQETKDLLAAASKSVSDIGDQADRPHDPLPCTFATRARAIALAIDDAFGSSVIAAFHAHWRDRGLWPPGSQGEIDLSAGDTFPSVLPSDAPFPIFSNAAYRLAQSEDLADQLQHIRRLSSGTNLAIKLVIDRVLEQNMRLLVRPPEHLKFGIACLGPSMLDSNFAINDKRKRFDFSSDLKDSLSIHHKAARLGLFYDVAFSDQALLEAFVTAADEKGINVLIFPELAFTEDGEKRVRDRFAELVRNNSSLKLVVLGSRHVLVGEPVPVRRNRLHIVGCNSHKGEGQVHSIYHHDKIGTFGFKGDQSCYYVEDIQRERTLRAIVVEGTLITALICKDVLQASVINDLQALSVRRLFVVAMSEKTDEFIYHLSELAVRCNTVSFLCCFAATGEVTAAIVGPGRHSTAIILRNHDPNSVAPRPRRIQNGFRISLEQDLPSAEPHLAWITTPIRDTSEFEYIPVRPYVGTLA